MTQDRKSFGTFNDKYLDIFSALEKHGILFCVLRNHDNLIDDESGDVDILVKNNEKGHIDEVLADLSKNLGYSIFYSELVDKNDHFVRLLIKNDGDAITKIILDFILEISIFDKKYIETEDALKNRIRLDNFYILDDQMEFFHILVHGIFSNGIKYIKRYSRQIRGFLEDGRDIPMAYISSIFGRFASRFVIRALKNNEVDKLFKYHFLLKILFLIKNVDIFIRFLSFLKRKILVQINFFAFKGKFVVITGPDGVGKSTATKIATELLNGIGITTHHLHLGFRPAVLPNRKKLGLGEPDGGGDVKSATNDRAFVDVLRYFYHFFDYVLDYYIHIRPKLVKGEIVIAERYFYDYLLHLKRKNLNVNERFVNWTFRLFMPKPNACILFVNDAEEILKRRQELTKDEIEEVISKGREYGKKINKFIEIKTDTIPEKVAIKCAKWLMCDYVNKND